ncbi:Hypothetical predicted protein [Paramuricea clavata]|uniref:Transposable element P transposase-like GTP-binding insertion domain-containing protein n=1 Tax=Paramuricea clavata TaxID=317549 RepID=A0A6S7HIJ4_PARCT|nr:Hypothetical predicted protein [Paramuricea clavata]
MKYTIQEDIGVHFLDKVVEEIKDGKTFSFVIDNIDWEEHVHEMRSDNQNESVHAVATSIVFDHVSSIHLPDEEPQQSLASCDVVKLVQLSDSDITIQKQVYKSIAAHILCEYIPTFKFLKDLVTHFDVPMQHKVEMQQKSLVVPFPVLFKDEKKYAEIVDVLDQLEKWVHQIYALADCGLHQLPKVSVGHINLKSFSKMNVSLATRVMSKTVLLALKCYYTKGEADETAKLCEMINDFFDCLNVRSFHEHERKRNAFWHHTGAPQILGLNGLRMYFSGIWLIDFPPLRFVLARSLHTKGLKCPCPFRHAKDYK